MRQMKKSLQTQVLGCVEISNVSESMEEGQATALYLQFKGTYR